MQTRDLSHPSVDFWEPAPILSRLFFPGRVDSAGRHRVGIERGVMASFSVRKGLNVRLAGAPEANVAEAGHSRHQAALVREGRRRRETRPGAGPGQAQRGVPRHRPPRAAWWSPSCMARAARWKNCHQGGAPEQAESFRPRYQPAEIAALTRDALLAHLQATGLLALIRQRPFGRMAAPGRQPKSIFVNGMATAPHLPDLNVVVKGRELAFQAGLDALTRLTAGKVFSAWTASSRMRPPDCGAQRRGPHVCGPHPAGNTSVHISRLAPSSPPMFCGPSRAGRRDPDRPAAAERRSAGHRIISVGGTGVVDGSATITACARAVAGQPAARQAGAGGTRIIRGDIFAGVKTSQDDSLHS
jgi:hypothetical protein